MVDMENANFSETWTDIELQSGGFNLKVERTYNSRTLFNGMFGFGWCSNFETSLTILPEKRIKRSECGAGQEVIYTTKSYNVTDVDEAVNKIIAAVKKGSKNSEDEIHKLREELRNNVDRREAEAKIYGIKTEIKSGAVFYAEEESTDKIVLRKNFYERTLSDGTIQKFNLQGRLISLADQNDNYVNFEYKNDRVSTISTNTGSKLSFSYNAHNKVESIKGPKGFDVSYQYEKVNDLVYVKSKTGSYKYAYDTLHNITLLQYPDGKKKTLRYNTDKDWVTSLTDRDGCEEKYDYAASKTDPQNNYTSTVVKKCDGKVVNQSKYEFWFKKRTSGEGKYLARLLTIINNSKTDITYHELFNRPTSITKDGKTTTYTYHSNSFLKSQKTGDKLITYDYDWRFNAVSEITEGKHKTKFEYNKNGVLISAKNTAGQVIKLAYDSKDRIIGINDQARRLIKIEYDDILNKPKLIERPGVGKIALTYKANGEVDDMKSTDNDPTATVQVLGALNNLLEIVAPARVNLGI